MGAFQPGILTRNPWVPRRPISVREYHLMGETGILHEDDRVELIEGEIVTMNPIGPGHAGSSNSLNRALVMAVGDHGVVAAGNPVVLDDYTEPQPDFTVLRPKPDDYSSGTPRPEDVLLVVEVADSSLRYDRLIKLPLYARHGIPEVWIVNVPARSIEVFRGPKEDRYTEEARIGREDTMTIAMLPDIAIPASAILR